MQTEQVVRAAESQISKLCKSSKRKRKGLFRGYLFYKDNGITKYRQIGRHRVPNRQESNEAEKVLSDDANKDGRKVEINGVTVMLIGKNWHEAKSVLEVMNKKQSARVA